MKSALVISGGGAKGAFAVGIVKSIYERFHDKGWFSIVGGSSTGALVATMSALLNGPAANDALELMVRVYSSFRTKDLLDRKKIFEFLSRQDCL